MLAWTELEKLRKAGFGMDKRVGMYKKFQSQHRGVTLQISFIIMEVVNRLCIFANV